MSSSQSKPQEEPPKKPEPRSAGAPTTREDAFRVLPEHAGDDEAGSNHGNSEHGEEKVSFTQFVKGGKDEVREVSGRWKRRLSVMGKKDEREKDEREKDKRKEDEAGDEVSKKV